MLSCRSFMVSDLRFKSLIHLESDFCVQCKVVVQFPSAVSQHNSLKKLSFPHYIVLVFSFAKLIDHVCMGLFFGLSLLLH